MGLQLECYEGAVVFSQHPDRDQPQWVDLVMGKYSDLYTKEKALAAAVTPAPADEVQTMMSFLHALRASRRVSDDVEGFFCRCMCR